MSRVASPECYVEDGAPDYVRGSSWWYCDACGVNFYSDDDMVAHYGIGGMIIL